MPYLLIFWAPNYGIKKKDMPIVQKYLDHFQNLHPDLVGYMNAVTNATDNTNTPLAQKIKFWPNSSGIDFVGIPLVLSIMTTSYKFTPATGLFAQLEATGINRRVLWEFLRATVEETVAVSEQEKSEYKRVMETMCRHNVVGGVAKLVTGMLWVLVGWIRDKTEIYVVPESTFEGIANVAVEADTIDWILQRGVLLYPTNKRAEAILGMLPNAMWGKFRQAKDLEKGVAGYWQMIDLRRE